MYEVELTQGENGEEMAMEDLAGLGKLADSQLVDKLYDDLASNAMKEGGGLVVDVVKTVRLITFPFQLAALLQDKLKARLDEVRRRVPADRRVGAAPSIAMPLLIPLAYMEDDNPLTELYVNLLARAIDKERQGEAHPAFVRIIDQLSPDEALLLFLLRDRVSVFFKFDNEGCLEWARVPANDAPRPWNAATPTDEDLTSSICRPEYTSMNLERVQALTLVRRRNVAARLFPFSLTQFGKLFVQACIPEDFKLDPGTDKGDTQ